MRWMAMLSLLLFGCGQRRAGRAGDACGPARGCEPGMTCQSGLCIPTCDLGSRWVRLPSGTQANLRAVWGSSAQAVWAVGEAGTADFYDGQTWRLVPVPMFQDRVLDLVAVHGSSANNVYALAAPPPVIDGAVAPNIASPLLRFDGKQWDFAGGLPNIGEPTGVFVTADNPQADVYVSIRSPNGTLLVRFNAGVPSLMANATSRTGATCSYLGKPNTGVWALQDQPGGPVGGIFVADCQTWQWDGKQGFIPLRGPETRLTNNIWGARPADGSAVPMIFGLESAENGGSPDVSMWNGFTWSTLTTALDGWTGGVSGTAYNRVFVTGNEANRSFGLYYDGNSVTPEPMPDGVAGLLGIWAASSGEVFAVGAKGVIVERP
jgi:hypothetical protein